MPHAARVSLAVLLLLGLLGPLTRSQDQAKKAWTSKTLGKQPIPLRSAVSPDGKTLAVGVDTGKGMAFDKPKDKPRPAKEIDFNSFLDVDYSLSFRDADTLKETKGVKLDCKELMLGLAFVPGRDQVVTTGKGGTFTVWDVKTGKAAGTFTHAPPRKKGAFMFQVAAAAGGKLKTFCSEMVFGYEPPPSLPALLWTPPADEKSSQKDGK